jgi:hypothetical protein
MDGVSVDGQNIPQPYSDNVIASLRDAPLVLIALGQDVVEELMEELVQLQLLNYDKMGREGGVLYKLDKDTFDRRWTTI